MFFFFPIKQPHLMTKKRADTLHREVLQVPDSCVCTDISCGHDESVGLWLYRLGTL